MVSNVTRGNIKIAGAVSAFKYDFRGKIALDIGSSTGGFTQFALEMGAKKVIAVEKGARQMMAPLRFDSRVELHEKTDIFDFVPEEKIDVILADVSFISLRPILKYAKDRLVKGNTDLLMMLKPQFEAESFQLNRGVVKNEKMRRDIIKGFEEFLRKHGFVVVQKKDNDLTGRKGNQERFYWLRVSK